MFAVVMLSVFCILSLASAAHDSSVLMSDGARAQLVKAIERIWDEQDNAFAGKSVEQINAMKSIGSKGMGHRHEQRTVGRFFIDTFTKEVAQQINVGPRCLDWDSRYVSLFPGCKELVNYQYADSKLTYSEKDGVQFLIGDLGLFDEGYLNSHPKFDLLINTQVFEHVPHFWKAMKGIALLTKPGGYVHMTVPFAYRFHPFPGDFWRYSPMGLLHLFESSGFDACAFAADGYRGVQLLSFGLSVHDVSPDYLTKSRSYNSLLEWSTNYALIAQLPTGIMAEKCSAFSSTKFTNEIKVRDIHKMAGDFWPAPSLE